MSVKKQKAAFVFYSPGAPEMQEVSRKMGFFCKRGWLLGLKRNTIRRCGCAHLSNRMSGAPEKIKARLGVRA